MIGILLQSAVKTSGDLSPFIDAFVGFFRTLAVIAGGVILLATWIALIGRAFTAHELGPPLAGVVFFVPAFALIYVTGLWRYVVVQHFSAFATGIYILLSVAYLVLLSLESLLKDDSNEELSGGDTA